jgi:hypothetical protein
MRLKLANLFAPEELKTSQPISSATLQQGKKTRDLFFFGGYDDLAAKLIRNTVLDTEVHHSANSLHRQAGLR